MTQNTEHQLSCLSDSERLEAYNSLVSGCMHLWSKGKLQEDRLKPILDTFMNLAENDPIFLAHFTSYVIKNTDSKDLKVVATFANSLSDADGTPFSLGSKYKKPNLRIISHAALQHLDPKEVQRVVDIANIKQVLGSKRKATHFARSLQTAVKKYIRFREQNPKALEGIKKVGLSNRFQDLYRSVHISPSEEAASILGWKQGSKKKGNVQEIEKKEYFNFEGLSDLEIAEKIRTEKLPATGVLGALPGKISPVIAVAVLEQCTGNQAVILRELFDKEGLLKNKEVMAFFTEKISEAKTALDRVERIKTDIDEEVQKVLKTAKSKKRKEQVGDIGKIFLHIDISQSMNRVIDYAKEKGSIIAECVQNPEENFHWGLFNDRGMILKQPDSFEKDAFQAALYGVRSAGMTDCLACYPYAREQGCDVDIFLTDQGHNGPPIGNIIRKYDNEGLGRPKAIVIVDFADRRGDCYFYDHLVEIGIPVSFIKPDALNESALVAQAVRQAILGPVQVIDEIMSTELLSLPQWYEAVNV
jgi:hypothetical protein